MRYTLILALATTPGFAASALASSDDAWTEFRADVQIACAALLPADSTPVIEVNPFGSERYGAALVTMAAGTGAERMVCIYDKQAGTAEITGPFAP
ncbi:hypothetical protein GEU84_008615 [Fertoebacter nigrum]|uniref:Uncharacterized protein n=1 Tax=Fertoeibacter niger TaxID=2656921 RepID=A0A8X8GWJ2_9RHOB|nr:hypothetical protein [Fertoeibacter niger]NUB44442.1 hypothetical protein [Fertoeibacter niger]